MVEYSAASSSGGHGGGSENGDDDTNGGQPKNWDMLWYRIRQVEKRVNSHSLQHDDHRDAMTAFSRDLLTFQGEMNNQLTKLRSEIKNSLGILGVINALGLVIGGLLLYWKIS